MGWKTFGFLHLFWGGDGFVVSRWVSGTVGFKKDVLIALFWRIPWKTLSKTKIALWNRPSQKERIVSQPTCFRGELLVLWNVANQAFMVHVTGGFWSQTCFQILSSYCWWKKSGEPVGGYPIIYRVSYMSGGWQEFFHQQYPVEKNSLLLPRLFPVRNKTWKLSKGWMVRFTKNYSYIKICENYNDLSRGHQNWWFSKGISPKCRKHSGLGIIVNVPRSSHLIHSHEWW